MITGFTLHARDEAATADIDQRVEECADFLRMKLRKLLRRRGSKEVKVLILWGDHALLSFKELEQEAVRAIRDAREEAKP